MKWNPKPWSLWALMSVLSAASVLAACSDDDDDDTTANDDDDVTSNDDDDTTDDDDDDDDITTNDDDDACPDPKAAEYPPEEAGDYVPYEGELKAAVTVYVDSFGMSHIFGSDDEDIFFVQGYRQASDRLFQMEMLRRRVSGTQAEIFGEGKLSEDKEARVVGFLRKGRQDIEGYKAKHPSVARSVEAFVAGINAYIADADASRNNAIYSPEWDAVEPGFRPALFKPEDVAAMALAQGFGQSFQGDVELIFSAVSLLVGQGVADDLLRMQPMLANYTTEPEPSQFPEAFPPTLTRQVKALAAEQVTPNLNPEALLELGQRLSGWTNGIGGGSNNWVVHGKHTASGFPMMANDPHLNLDIPGNFVETHLVNVNSGNNTVGINIPGFPGVLIGHNEYVGWAITNPFADTTDIYIESTSTDEKSVLFRGEQVPIEFIDEPIKVRPSGGAIAGASTVNFQARVVPHHGPVLNDLLPASLAEDLPFTVSFRWGGLEPQYLAGFVIKNLNARNAEEFEAALQYFGIAAANMIYSDVNGNIGYWVPGYYPNRPWDWQESPPSNWLVGSGDFEWCGFLPFDEVPHLFNPEKGYVVTANNSVLGEALDNDPSNGPRWQGHFYSLGTRAHRITNRLEELIDGDHPITLEDMQAIITDHHSVIADEILPLALSTTAGAAACEPPVPAKVCDAFQMLKDWDRENAVDSTGATLFHWWLAHLLIETYGDETGQGILGAVSSEYLFEVLLRPLRLMFAGFALESGTNYWDDIRTEGTVETQDEIVLRALELAVNQLTGALGADMETWTWGRVHVKQWEHMAGLSQFDTDTFPNDGGVFDVDVANINLFGDIGDGVVGVVDPPLNQGSGPNMRYTVEMNPAAGWPTCNVLPGGNSGNPESPHYQDQAPLWLNNECRYVPFTPGQVVEEAVLQINMPAGFPTSVIDVGEIGLGN